MVNCGGFLHKTVPALRVEAVVDWLGRPVFVAVDHHEGWCLTCEVVTHA